MTLPVFPEFTEIDMSLKGIIKDRLSAHPIEASEYTFTNLFAFRDAYDFRLSMLKDHLIILRDRPPAALFCPVGGDDVMNLLDDLFDYMKTRYGRACLERIPAVFVNAHLLNKGFSVEEERDQFDYVYDVQELATLKGRKFHDKKNKANKFRKVYNYEYAVLTPDLIEECLEFEHHWCEVRECHKYYGLHKERCAILEILNNFESLNIKGGIIRVDNQISALTLGEKILSDTFVIHIEKANSEMPGLYQVINQEFLMHEAGGCRFVNREQDLGIEGLRKSKMSYNPIKFIEKYKVCK